MQRTYSRRMLAPFTGQLQVVETDEARAMSLDGRHWGLQYRLAEGGNAQRASPDNDSGSEVRYARVGNIVDNRIERPPLPRALDNDAVTAAIERLAQLVASADLPFAAIDTFEYWLLEESTQKPLALLHSAIDAEETRTRPPLPQWLTMPDSQLKIENPQAESADYVAPVNHRLQNLIEERAGWNPVCAWFDRNSTAAIDFPPCLISESWEQEEQGLLCRLYISRLAPRLLTLHDLSRDDRRRLEQAARENACEVERFHPLYPEIVDHKLMRALLVEARLRRGAEPGSR